MSEKGADIPMFEREKLKLGLVIWEEGDKDALIVFHFTLYTCPPQKKAACLGASY